MKGKKLRNIISAAIVCASVLTLTPVEASIGKTGNGTEKPFSWDNATVYFALMVIHLMITLMEEVLIKMERYKMVIKAIQVRFKVET